MNSVDRVLETRLSPHCSEGSHCTAKARAAGAEGSRRWPSRGSLVTVWGEVTLGGSSSGQAVSGLDEPHQDPGSAWRLLVSSGSACRRLTNAWDHGRESRMGGDERGQGAGPPVHAVPSGTSSSWTG